jgi:hypothetical protein
MAAGLINVSTHRLIFEANIHPSTGALTNLNPDTLMLSLTDGSTPATGAFGQ